MKYLKTIAYEFILILIFTLIYTILYYFNITSTSFNNALKIISFILIFVLTGIRIGRLSNKKGWLEGLKIALITIVMEPTPTIRSWMPWTKHWRDIRC